MRCDVDRPLMELRGVSKRFRRSGGNSLFQSTFEAVRDVSLTVRRGETLGIVGESGCGKSTVARVMMGIERPTRGEVWFDGVRIDRLSQRALRPLRPRFQMVFQDSASSLNPRKTVGALIAAPMRFHGVARGAAARERTAALLDTVGLPAAMALRYPHELSGGQRQRVCIARALALNPELLVLDEPVSALDVSVQAQVLNLLRDLQAKLDLTCVFIGHGLGAVRYVSDRIAVMYMGRVVETGPAEALFARPAHPYTRALLDAAPSADYALRDRPRLTLAGEPDETPPPGACSLCRRCPLADDACLRHDDALRPVPGEEGRQAACARGMKDAASGIE